MEARIIGPASELGPFETLTIQDQPLSREWSKIDATEAQLEKLKGNRYVEVRGSGATKAPAEPKPAAELAQIRDEDSVETMKRRLDELGVSYGPRSSKSSLRAALDKAEQAQAEAEAEAEAAQAEADRLAAEAGH